jgi:hypothetical protein
VRSDRSAWLPGLGGSRVPLTRAAHGASGPSRPPCGESVRITSAAAAAGCSVRVSATDRLLSGSCRRPPMPTTRPRRPRRCRRPAPRSPAPPRWRTRRWEPRAARAFAIGPTCTERGVTRARRPWVAGLICAVTCMDRLPSRSTSRPGCAQDQPGHASCPPERASPGRCHGRGSRRSAWSRQNRQLGIRAHGRAATKSRQSRHAPSWTCLSSHTRVFA